jgi:hypothetical protein
MSKSSRKKPISPVKQNPLAKPVDGLNTMLSRSASSTENLSVGPEQIGSIQPISSPQGPELIRFDKRVKITLGILVGLFLLMTLTKVYWGSIPIWNRLLPDGSPETRGLLAGTPRQIRMDDYAVGAPWIISSANNNFSVENEAIGGLKAPLLTVPVKHSINIFKYWSWGFMTLDMERGYAFMYNSGPFVLVIFSLLFFLLVTRNQFWLSLTGSLTLFLSSGTVAWTFIPASPVGLCCLAFVATIYFICGRTLKSITLSVTLLIWVIVSYVLTLYPPYQVPLAYLFGMVLIGYVINERKSIFPINKIAIKLLSIVGVAIIAGLILNIFREDVQETIKAVTSTVYPGKRSEIGGTGFIANWYSEYYSWFFSDSKFPKSWLNVCEMAHYLNFVPTLIPFSIALFAFTKRIDWMLVLASLFVILMWVWIEIGFPKEIATASLMSMSPTRRSQIPMGIGSIVLLFLYLSRIQKVDIKTPFWLTLTGILLSVAFVIYTAYVNVNDSDGIIRTYQTFIPVVFFILMNVLLLFSLKIPYRIPIFCSAIFLFLLPNIKTNPLSVGLSPITENAFYKAVRQLVEQDPNARWIVNGNQFVTYMVTATGAKQITGVKFIPDRKHIFSVLDPQMKRDSAYNRYAHVVFSTYIPGTGRDTVVLANQYEDGYVIAMDPCSPKLKQLNVKYMVFDHATQPVETRCMKEVAKVGSLIIYQVNL